MRLAAAEANELRALLRCLRVTTGCNRPSGEWSSGCNTIRPNGVTLSEPAHTDPSGDARQDQDAFRRGIEQFNSGYFFEAHETWEEVWLRSPEPEKTFLQGIIQIAAAFHHHSRGNARGARTLLGAGLARLARFPDTHRGIMLGPLRSQAAKWVSTLAAGQASPSETPIPRIEFSRDE
jgi:hypothetical protein